MTTRKQLRRRVEVLQKELRRLTDCLANLRAEGERVVSQQQKVLDELHSACDSLGMSWANGCPSFKKDEKDAHCVIYGWTDAVKSARFCINCPVAHDEAEIRLMMCKLRPQVKLDE